MDPSMPGNPATYTNEAIAELELDPNDQALYPAVHPLRSIDQRAAHLDIVFESAEETQPSY